MLGEGEPGRWKGDVTLLAGGLAAISSIVVDVDACTLELHSNMQGPVKTREAAVTVVLVLDQSGAL